MKKVKEDTFCGFIAIVGRPNVGKSTLINNLVAEKISITADKPQTTRHKILGIKTIANKQAVYIDTPGIHFYNKKKINQYMNKTAFNALYDVDVVIFVIEALDWKKEDELVLSKLKKIKKPIILAVNKIDLQKDKNLLLPFLNDIKQKLDFTEIIPISAKKNIQTEELQKFVFNLLPTNPHFFLVEQTTDCTEKFRMAEILREKLTRNLVKELPYAITVEIEHLEKKQDIMLVHAIIWVERDSQKSIVIGKNGEMIKKIGKQSRLDINKIFDCRSHLQIWVKVRNGWTDNKQALQNFGYIDIK
jgi:GTPase